jgi:hypothetical protein
MAGQTLHDGIEISDFKSLVALAQIILEDLD